jgi:2-amino-4-hydroxy-6-hydroxymethyldihydropteridine diphosphokinase
MPRTLISLGANLGNVRESMQAAKRLLWDAFSPDHVRLSHLYRTPPVGGPTGQGDFLNAVAAIETDRSVWDVWNTIKSIEAALGRQRQHRWEARRIDIDLLLYDQQRIWTPHLKVPHPRMCMRTFVIQPAAEIVSDWIEPVSQWSIQALNDHLAHTTLAPMRIVCVDAHLMSRLQMELHQALGGQSMVADWIVPATTQDAADSGFPDRSMTSNKYKLTVVAVASPDPTTVLWEDYSHPWAVRLNMKESATSHPNIAGPRYLLPANDPKWAAHEIIAAHQATMCSVEMDGEFD